MFRLVRFLFSLAVFAVMLWFATTIPLGKRTLWGHLHAIFATQEAKDLAEGTKEEARKMADRVREELNRDGGDDDKHEAHKRAAPPLDPVGEKDQKSLDKLVREKVKPRK
jgi:hypothetical protein